MKYELKIPKPCHEDWSKMSPTEKGRFCKSCKKEVIDFTAMTDRQTLSKLNEKEGEQVCGRFQTTQLDKELKMSQGSKNMSKVAAAVALTAILASSEPVYAQGAVVKIEKIEQSKLHHSPIIDVNYVQKNIHILKGKVVDKNSGKPLLGANVYIKGTDYATQTDKQGNFSFHYQEKNALKDTLVVQFLGFKEEELQITTKRPMHIALQKELLIFGEVKMGKVQLIENKGVLDRVKKVFEEKNKNQVKKDDQKE